jgi:hypothetical protein
MTKDIYESFIKLENYCNRHQFKGYDPFDGLNSKLFQSIPFLKNNKLVRLAWIQLFKRCPLNLRDLMSVEKEYNPKALGLFLSTYCNLYKIQPGQVYMDKINFFSQKILEHTNMNWSGACWGYNFDWQSRAFFQPKNAPTVVVTSFIGNALLDAYEITGNIKLFQIVRSSCDFFLKDLNRTYDVDGNFALSYSPLDKSIVFNASLLGSRLLSRVFSFTQDDELINNAKKAVQFCCNYQKSNGSWAYGNLSFHNWIDSFHTGYNLECIADYMKYSGDKSFEGHLMMGFNYYIDTFFSPNGIPKYYSNSIYPIDVHAPAQLVITLAKLNKLQTEKILLERVLQWVFKHMQSKEGYFYYQINKYFSNRIPYMRWAQAWMLYAFSTYFLYSNLLIDSRSGTFVSDRN